MLTLMEDWIPGSRWDEMDEGLRESLQTPAGTPKLEDMAQDFESAKGYAG